jgi:hypothetical protein
VIVGFIISTARGKNCTEMYLRLCHQRKDFEHGFYDVCGVCVVCERVMCFLSIRDRNQNNESERRE